MWILKENSVAALKQRLNKSNCLNLWLLAQRFKLEALQELGTAEVCVNAEIILQNEDNLKLLDQECIKQIFSMDDLVVSNEYILYQVLRRWVKQDKDKRKRYFCQLFQLIKLVFLSRETFSRSIMAYQHVYTTCPQCKQYVTLVLQYFLDKQTEGFDQFQLLPRKYVNRTFTENSVLVLDQFCKNIKLFDLKQQRATVTTVEEVPINPTFPLITFYRGKIFIFGIYNRQAFCYDFFKTKTWTELPKMINTHKNGFAIGFADTIICGGESIKTDCFHLELGAWQPWPDFKFRGAFKTAVVLKNKLHTIGGKGDGLIIAKGPLSIVECYDIEANKFTVMPFLKEPRYGAGSASIGNKIIVVGGTNKEPLSSVEMFIEGSKTWTKMASMAHPRSFCGVSAIGGKLFICGGRSCDSTVELWDDKFNQWQTRYEESLKDFNRCKMFTIEIN